MRFLLIFLYYLARYSTSASPLRPNSSQFVPVVLVCACFPLPGSHPLSLSPSPVCLSVSLPPPSLTRPAGSHHRQKCRGNAAPQRHPLPSSQPYTLGQIAILFLTPESQRSRREGDGVVRRSRINSTQRAGRQGRPAG